MKIIDNNFNKLVIIGLITGIIASFIGGGAEILIIPLLIYSGVFNNYKIAIGTSLASLLLPIGIFAVIFYNRIKCDKERCINWKYALILSIFFTIGTLASYFSVKLNSNIYKLIFAYLIIFIGIFIIITHKD
jgi:uncharacterized membrane protein YfcA